MPLDFHSYSIGLNLAIFGVAAVAVWFAGARLAGYADSIAARTNLSRAFVGLILLGVATSLPEVATTFTGALIGNARLVTANLLGGVALQVTILALVDALAVRGALTYYTPHPVVLFQGVMLLVLLAVALAGATAGEPLGFLGLGLTPVLLAIGYVFTARLSQRDALPRWQATHAPPRQAGTSEGPAEDAATRSVTSLWTLSAAGGLVILFAGWALASTGDALAEQTGLGANFVGFALVAGSTSLPEVSTTLGAIRRGNFDMAVSNILGTNCLEMALFLPADAVYRGGPILASADRAALFAAALGMIVTGIFLVGLLQRRERTIFGMGIDSFAVLVTYVIGLVGLYRLR